MGCMWLLGVVLWTGIVLSAVHFSSAGEALSEVNNLACTGSSCGIETVKKRSLIKTALVTGRGILTIPELSSTDRQVYTDAEHFERDYSETRGPPPPKHSTPGQAPHKPDPRPDPPPTE